jgi:hypothetical protein
VIAMQRPQHPEVIDVANSPYCPLNASNGEIRIATLAPGSYDDVLKIRLSITGLSKDVIPDYEALSYVWRHEIAAETAFIDGVATTIGSNLDVALRHLRCEDIGRILWVDAASINQADIPERNAQVSLMNRIYSSASTVLIWLGPGDCADTEAMNDIEALRMPSDLQTFNIFMRISRLPWLRRVWVAQEFALAQRDPSVCLGKTSLSWTRFHQFFEILGLKLACARWDWAMPKQRCVSRILQCDKQHGRTCEHQAEYFQYYIHTQLGPHKEVSCYGSS